MSKFSLKGENDVLILNSQAFYTRNLYFERLLTVEKENNPTHVEQVAFVFHPYPAVKCKVILNPNILGFFLEFHQQSVVSMSKEALLASRWKNIDANDAWDLYISLFKLGHSEQKTRTCRRV